LAANEYGPLWAGLTKRAFSAGNLSRYWSVFIPRSLAALPGGPRDAGGAFVRAARGKRLAANVAQFHFNLENQLLRCGQ
jgi:hypothetical protein